MNFLNLKAVLSLNGSGFALGLKRAESASKQFAKEIKGEFARAFGTAAIIAYGAKVVNMADNIIDLSDRLGISTKALQEWGYAAKKSGSDIEAVTRFLEQLAVAREKALGGDKGSLESFSKLGVSQSDLESLSLDEISRKIAGTVKGGNIQELIGSLKDVGGRSAGELVAAMKSLDDLSKSAPIISDESLEKLKLMKTEALGLADIFAGPVADGIGLFADAIRNAFSVFKVGAGGAAAFLGALSGGASLKEAGKAAMDVLDAELEEGERRKKRIQDNIDARHASEAQANAPRESSRLFDFTPLKQAAEKAAQMSINRPGLTSWQSAGAAIRFNPDSKVLQDIAKSSRDTANNTRPETKRPSVLEGGFGGGF